MASAHENKVAALTSLPSDDSGEQNFVCEKRQTSFCCFEMLPKAGGGGLRPRGHLLPGISAVAFESLNEPHS